MRNNYIRDKITVIVVGLIAGLFFLEIGLRSEGAFIFLFSQKRDNYKDYDRNGEYRIMCLGESVTFMGGENSYPAEENYFTNNCGGSFGHCTPKGNRLLAKNITNNILKKYFGSYLLKVTDKPW